MKKRIWDEKKYNISLNEVGKDSYRLFHPDDDLIPILFNDFPETYGSRFMGVGLSSGTSIATVDFACEGITISKGSQIVAWRTFRYCEHDGIPHLNADDNIIFPDQKGNIWKLARNDSPDHYIEIAEYAGIQHIADAYHLPINPYGPCCKYVENGASMPIRIERRPH